ncbi:DNA mismatch repair protein MutS [Pelosinus fermentans]|uniref:DNA mismatch repair protein MutS n=1 Tax=Pelosinus fermentans JBW45 TaxID=1192197 RepID=I9NSB5_9FIRM|nr:DNA mismatch repair protein MutS [Pelosinus fermentans]AJQ27622.1 DNA mismatch repair protein mutS [Pelosinus fermentans JBW45]
MTIKYTPMMEQYLEIKSKHENEILFFRMGDFYEMFFTDAELASRELEITLTARDGGQRVPMCGIPYHAADTYIAKLISKGYKVAICEQVEDPKQAKGIVKREVIKIITPGTIIAENLLPDNNNNYLAVLYEEEEELILAAADISTGECLWATFLGSQRLTALYDQLFRLMPTELVLASKIENIEKLNTFISNRISHCTHTTLAIDNLKLVSDLPKQHFMMDDLPQQDVALAAIGCLLYYLHQTVKTDLSHINRLINYNAFEYLTIDSTSMRNLEVTRNVRDGGKKDTLLYVLDYTKTAMGGRLLKKWLEYPLMNTTHIIQRQDSIAELLEKPTLRQTIHETLANIYDLERILTRIEVGTASARDLIALKSSLVVLPTIKEQLQKTNTIFLSNLHFYLHTHVDLVTLVDTAIVDNPPFSVREGGLIKRGYDLELDELHTIARDSKQFVQDIETRERENTGIKSLKVGYNKVFGYYIEVTHSHTASVPLSYVRKQTLANAERYITPELKEFESKILGAQEKIVTIEYRLFSKIRDHIKVYIKEIQETARQLAQLDAIISLSEVAFRNNYIRPTITQTREITIKDGRHPIVERLLKRELFVPNDSELNHHSNEIMIITGPNMAGKSTYMRQVALLVLMAQIGSFIPAREAIISPVDRIFTRVGASDDLSTGQSTFMVEMNEVAQILKHATSQSLIILDEIGRGTSTFDGMSIARAVIEYIKERVKAKTLFATHYHELTELADYHKIVKNYSVAVKERGSDVVFLRRIIPGGADKSYGIHVAQLAGLPQKVIKRAQELLVELEQNHVQSQNLSLSVEESAAATTPMSLFTSSTVDELLAIDITTITPIEAINILYQLQNQARQESGKL